MDTIVFDFTNDETDIFTPEGWIVTKGKELTETGQTKIWEKNGEMVATIYAKSNATSMATARRIVLCMDACKGMKDPNREIQTLRQEVVTPTIIQTHRLVNELSDVKNARDELLASLNDVIEMANAYEVEYSEANKNYRKDVQEENKKRIKKARTVIEKMEAHK